MTTAEPAGSPLIEAVDLSKHYKSIRALDQVSVQLPHASIGLLGPNGAGKTTFLKLLLGLSVPTSGDLFVFETNVRSDPIWIRRKIGFMPESDCLATDVSAFDFVRHMAEVSGLPSRAARLRTAEILYLCGLDEERFRPIKEYSTGMKQRVKLAQALVHGPELVFLDEPTNGLDPAGHDEMLTLIRRLHDDLGMAVILSSHVLEDVERVCDYVMMIDSGTLIGSGYIHDLMESRQEINLEIDGNPKRFAVELGRHNIAVTEQDGALVISYTDDTVFDLIRDSAVESDSAIRSLTSRRTSLEEFYIGMVDDRDNAESGKRDAAD